MTEKMIISKNAKIEKLKLRYSIEDFLKKCDIFKISDLLEYTEEDIAFLRRKDKYMQRNRLGNKRAREINDVLKRYGFKLKEEPKESLLELNLSGRVYSLLKENNINTIEQLTKMTEGGLLTVKYIGPETVKEIKMKLEEKGKSLRVSYKQQSGNCYRKRRKRTNFEPEIKKLSLTGKTYNALMRLGIDTIDKILNYPYQDLIKKKGIGDKMLEEVDKKVKVFISQKS